MDMRRSSEVRAGREERVARDVRAGREARVALEELAGREAREGQGGREGQEKLEGRVARKARQVREARNARKARMESARAQDSRPYIGDAGRRPVGVADMATVAIGMVLLALAVGFVIGFLVFAVMNLSAWLTGLLWNGYLDSSLGVPFYPLVVCSVGGLVIGLWTYFSGSRIESLEVVMAEFKQTGSYDLGGVGKATVSFLLPLVFGGSVGFEAGLTGIITAGCCWIRDKLKRAGLRAADVADVTIAASLSAIFGAPFAGIVAGAESTPKDDGEDVLSEADVNDYNMRRPEKLVLYTAAAFGAFAGIHVFSALFGASAGFPRFDEISAEGAGYLWAVLALAGAYVLTLVYFASQSLFCNVGARLGNEMLGTIVKPLIAGVVMGAFAMAFPYVMFSGEEQCHDLMASWPAWTGFALVATGLLKAFVTPMCINMGWVGGNFCPSIFAGAALGLGMAALTGADPVLMITVVVTAFLAGVLRKPVLAIAVLLLCFPANGIVWMGIAGIVGAYLPIPRFLLQKAEEPAAHDVARSDEEPDFEG